MLRVTPLVTSKRLPLAIESASLVSLEQKNDSLQLQLVKDSGERTSLHLPLIWLRDHCKNPKSYNHATKQRVSNMVGIFDEAQVHGEDSIQISEQDIHIKWRHGLESKFGLKEILNSAVKRKISSTWDYRTTWDSSLEISRLQCGSFAVSDFCKDLYRYGIVMIEGVDPTPESVKKLCESLGPLHETYLGYFWNFNNQQEDHEDTAYSNDAIGPHTDGTYYEQVPGIQVFNCIVPAEKGGESIMVDGKRCVDILRAENPEAYEILSKTEIPCHFLEGGAEGNVWNIICKDRPVIVEDSSGHFSQLRYNAYDRAPFKCLSYDSPSSAREALRWYKAYCHLSQIINDPQNGLVIPLKPHQVLFVDNFRVMHSRTAFKGYRQMTGCYMNRDHFLGKARNFVEEEIRHAV